MQDGISRYLQEQREWLRDFLSELLAIPSESGREQDAMAYLQRRFQQMDIHTRLLPLDNGIRKHRDYSDPVPDIDYSGRHNLALWLPGTSGRVIALNTHVDVVPPSPGQHNAYRPVLDEKGVMHARGACDAKGQIAAMALLFKAAREFAPIPAGLAGHVVVEEEFGGNGTLALLEGEKDFHADALINLEPTDLRLMTSVRGAVWFDMTFPGISGHAGSAENTLSATDKAIGAVALLKQYHRELLERSKDYGLFRGMNNPMPLTIGQFEAGVWPAMVPGQAHIAGVLGLLPNVTKDIVMEEISQLFAREENRSVSDGMTLRFTYRHNAVELPVDHPVAKGMSAACQRSGVCGEPTAMTASTDAIYYQERGIPALTFGPGRISDAHSTHEQVALDDVMKAAEVLYRFAAEKGEMQA